MGVYIWVEQPLKSYEEIIAMANDEGEYWTNTIAELNTAPADYYNYLNGLGKLSNQTINLFTPSNGVECLIDTNNRYYLSNGSSTGGYGIGYSNGTWDASWITFAF